jgi:predicted RNA binding protein YcfA (HicA-like mRNA interferase family)
MKKIELIKKLEDAGYKITKHGLHHTWYSNQETQKSQPIPKDAEVDDHLVKHIIKQLSSA